MVITEKMRLRALLRNITLGPLKYLTELLYFGKRMIQAIFEQEK